MGVLGGCGWMGGVPPAKNRAARVIEGTWDPCSLPSFLPSLTSPVLSLPSYLAHNRTIVFYTALHDMHRMREMREMQAMCPALPGPARTQAWAP